MVNLPPFYSRFKISFQLFDLIQQSIAKRHLGCHTNLIGNLQTFSGQGLDHLFCLIKKVRIALQVFFELLLYKLLEEGLPFPLEGVANREDMIPQERSERLGDLIFPFPEPLKNLPLQAIKFYLPIFRNPGPKDILRRWDQCEEKFLWLWNRIRGHPHLSQDQPAVGLLNPLLINFLYPIGEDLHLI